MAVAAGEEAFDDAFDAGRALGQRLDVLTQVGQTAPDIGQVSTNFRSEVLDVGADFGAKGVVVSARVAPEREHQTGQGSAHSQNANEFGGHGRLLGVGLCRRRPCDLNGSTGRGIKDAGGVPTRRWAHQRLSQPVRGCGRGAVVRGEWLLDSGQSRGSLRSRL